MRFQLLFAFLATAFLLAGCNTDGVSTGGTTDVDLDSIGQTSVFDQFAYAAGFQTAQQIRGDSALLNAFDRARFEQGYRDALTEDTSGMSYVRGYEIGTRVRQDTTRIEDAELFLAAFLEGLDSDSSRISDDELQQLGRTLQDSLRMRELRERAATDSSAQAELDAMAATEAEGDAFMQDVAQREGIQRMANGVLYTVDAEGNGASPSTDDVVNITYEGRLPDGTVFDQSDEPVPVPVQGFIPGVSEALQEMKPGERRTLYVPADQAYGLQGVTSPDGTEVVPPNSPLVFDLTLVEIADDAQMQRRMQQMRRQMQQQGGGR